MPADTAPDRKETVRLLFVGDVFGRPGREALSAGIALLSREAPLDGIFINGENLAGGRGVTPRKAEECFRLGVSAMTTGNHLFDQKEAESLLSSERRLLRPENYSPGCPGSGHRVYDLAGGVRVGLSNLSGRAFMGPSDCPFAAADRVLEDFSQDPSPPDFIAFDIHAEATGEKQALAFHLDGRADLLYGTHTHVQTNDLTRYPEGLWFVGDVGMTGPRWSIVGAEPLAALSRYRTQVPRPFRVAGGETLFCGLLVTLDLGTRSRGGRAHVLSTRLVREIFPGVNSAGPSRGEG
ncbi:MAG: TIGR00282 family metallophosphoesterase [Leptospirales bacterium]